MSEQFITTWWYVRGPKTDEVPTGIYATSDESAEWALSYIPYLIENYNISQDQFSVIEVNDVSTRTETEVQQ